MENSLADVVKELQSINLGSNLILDAADEIRSPLLRAIPAIETTLESIPAIETALQSVPAVQSSSAQSAALLSSIRRILGSMDMSLQLMLAHSAKSIKLQSSKKFESFAKEKAKQTEGVAADLSGLKMPDLPQLGKGLLFAAFPKLANFAVKGIENIVEAIMKIDSTGVKEKVDVISGIGLALLAFGEIKWNKVLLGTVMIRLFAGRFASLGKVLGSKKMLESLAPLEKFASEFAEPIDKISQSLLKFAQIKWTKVLLGTTLMKLVAKAMIAGFKGIADSLANTKTITSALTKFDKLVTLISSSITKFSTSMSSVGKSLIFIAIGIGALGLALKSFEGIKLETIGIVAAAVGSLGLLGKLIGNSWKDMAKGALSIGLLSASIYALTLVLDPFSKLDFKQIGIGILTVGGFAAVAALLGLALGPIATGALAIAALGASLIPFAYAAQLAAPAIDQLITSFAKLKDVPMLSLMALGPALAAIGAGLAVFSAGGLISGVVDGLGKLFGIKSPFDKIIELGNAAPGLATIADSLKLIAQLSDIDPFKNLDADKVVESINKINAALWNLMWTQKKVGLSPLDLMVALNKMPAPAGYSTNGQDESMRKITPQSNIQPMSSSIGSQLNAAGGSTTANAVTIINNNNGGNSTTNMSQSTNNNQTTSQPIITGSAYLGNVYGTPMFS